MSDSLGIQIIKAKVIFVLVIIGWFFANIFLLSMFLGGYDRYLSQKQGSIEIKGELISFDAVVTGYKRGGLRRGRPPHLIVRGNEIGSVDILTGNSKIVSTDWGRLFRRGDLVQIEAEAAHRKRRASNRRGFILRKLVFNNRVIADSYHPIAIEQQTRVGYASLWIIIVLGLVINIVFLCVCFVLRYSIKKATSKLKNAE